MKPNLITRNKHTYLVRTFMLDATPVPPPPPAPMPSTAHLSTNARGLRVMIPDVVGFGRQGYGPVSSSRTKRSSP